MGGGEGRDGIRGEDGKGKGEGTGRRVLSRAN